MIKSIIAAGICSLMVACGPAGADGKDGANLVSNLLCLYSETGIGFQHSIGTFEDGTVLTVCEVDGTNAGFSSQKLWGPGESATKASCVVVADNEGNGTIGRWQFTKLSGNTSQVKYIDPSSGFNNRTFVLSCVESK